MSYYTAIIFLNIFAMFVIQTCIARSNTLTKKRKRIFHELFTVIIVAAFCEWMGNYLQGSGSTTRILHIVVKALELSIAPAIAFLVSWIIEKRFEKIITVFLIIHAAIEWLSGIFGFIYYVDGNSTYVHEEFYWIYIVVYLVSIIYCVIIILRNTKKYQYNGIGYLLLVVAFMLTGIIIQLCDSSLKVDYTTVAIAAIMLYVLTLEMIYQTDDLTELINRRGYENCIAHIEQNCIVLFFDVDQFKMINDTYGHSFGDTVLKMVGTAIRTQYAKYGKCFRYGGDEFCVILTKELDRVEEINGNFFAEIIRLREKEKRLPYVSIGYTYYDPENQNIQDVVQEADQMMYQYKEDHRKVHTIH